MSNEPGGTTSPNGPEQGGVSRRAVVKGAASLAFAVPVLAACGSSSSGKSTDTASSAPASAPAGAQVGGTVTFGSNASDAVPKAAYVAMFDALKAKVGTAVKVNTVDHNTFQEQINSYLQGKPDDVFTWFAGYRMQFFAKKGLVGDISDVWATIGANYSDAFKKASTGEDGKQYFVPIYNYPWAVFYLKSLWKEKGYEVPKTLAELKTLGARMQKDGIAPIAFADKDGWPAMGTFDILNMRVNGYDFHMSLMAGKESWQDAKVKKVFSTWAELLPLHQPGFLGRTWQEAAQSLGAKKSGMYLLGSFVGQQLEAAVKAGDLDFFTFPELDSTIGADAIDAPIDGLMMSKSPKDEKAAKALLAFAGTAEGQLAYLKTDSNDVAAAKDADPSGYNALQKKAAELIGAQKGIAQFMDRDTRPDFASTVMIPSIQSFLKNPKDIDGITKSIEAQKKSIFAT